MVVSSSVVVKWTIGVKCATDRENDSSESKGGDEDT